MTEERECIDLFELMELCVGDKVEIVVRSTRAMVSYRGVLKAISNHAILLQNKNSLVAIRLSEIKMAKKVNK